jgi:hypothetical protein
MILFNVNLIIIKHMIEIIQYYNVQQNYKYQYHKSFLLLILLYNKIKNK